MAEPELRRGAAAATGRWSCCRASRARPPLCSPTAGRWRPACRRRRRLRSSRPIRAVRRDAEERAGSRSAAPTAPASVLSRSPARRRRCSTWTKRQRRIGTVTALGPHRAAAGEQCRRRLAAGADAAAPTDRPLAIDAATVARRAPVRCEYDVRGPEEFEAEQIETGKTLILVPCGSGAWYQQRPGHRGSCGGRVTTMVAPFDSQWGSRPKAGRS